MSTVDSGTSCELYREMAPVIGSVCEKAVTDTAFRLYNFGSAIMRAVGDTRRPLYFLIVSGISNVLLNLLFVIVFKMEVAGVALATIIANAISGYLIVRTLMTENGPCRLNLKKLKIDFPTLRSMILIGLPAFAISAAVTVQSSE